MVSISYREVVYLNALAVAMFFTSHIFLIGGLFSPVWYPHTFDPKDGVVVVHFVIDWYWVFLSAPFFLFGVVLNKIVCRSCDRLSCQHLGDLYRLMREEGQKCND